MYSCLLLTVETECLVDFNQTFGRLVKRLYGVVLGVIEPGTEDVFAFQNIGHFQLILLCRFQQRITMQLRVSAADVRDGILHGPVVGIVLVAAQGELEDMSRGRHIVQVEDGIPVPLAPDGSLVMLHGKGSVQDKVVAETLAEAGIDIPGLLAAVGLHIAQGIRRGQTFTGFGVVIILITVVDAGGVDGSVVQVPAFAQTVFLCQKELPAIDALAVFRVEIEFLVLHAAM